MALHGFDFVYVLKNISGVLQIVNQCRPVDLSTLKSSYNLPQPTRIHTNVFISDGSHRSSVIVKCCHPLNQRSASNVTRSAIKSLIIRLLPSSHLTKHNGLVGLDTFISVVLWFTTRTATSYVYETRLKADRHIWVHRLRIRILLILIILVEFANFYDFLKC